MQLFMRRYGSQSVAAGADAAILAWPIPAKCSLNYLKGEVHIIGSSAVALNLAHVYAVQGWLLKSETPNDFSVMDTLWDKFVPKDTDTIDLDSAVGANTASMMELANVNVAQLLDQEIGSPERIFNRSKLLSPINGYTQLLNSNNLYFPNDYFDLSISKKYSVRENTGLIFGVGSPDMVDVGVNNDVVPTTSGDSFDGFYVLQHIEDFLDKAMIEATPFTEAGAESPYEDIMNFLIDTLESVNENTVLFEAQTWAVWGKAIAGIRTPGRLAHTAIGPDAQA